MYNDNSFAEGYAIGRDSTTVMVTVCSETVRGGLSFFFSSDGGVMVTMALAETTEVAL